jgi:hypothetical protein
MILSLTSISCLYKTIQNISAIVHNKICNLKTITTSYSIHLLTFKTKWLYFELCCIRLILRQVLFLKGIVFLLGFTFARTQFNVNEDSTFLVFETLFQWTNYSWNHILLVVTFRIHLWTRGAFKCPILLVMFELCAYEFALGFPNFVGEI